MHRLNMNYPPEFLWDIQCGLKSRTDMRYKVDSIAHIVLLSLEVNQIWNVI